ncbi:MAG: adenosylcobinamide-phosphate synthase CbiB, partial [Pseudomonadota bacterium]
MGTFTMAFVAVILDRIFGEPDALWDRAPHPTVAMGNLVNWLDEALNRGGRRIAKGILACVVLVIVAGVTARLIAWVPDFGLLEILGAAVLIAQKSLVEHVRAVADALRQGLPQGRNAVSMIVGRDTGAMTEAEVSRAAIESAAENFSDGVVAPVFYFLIFGLPGIVIYKMINTADSMIGHRTPEYAEFGMAAAKLDDVLNWVPARISAGLIAAAFASKAALDVAFEDADLHRSPNAGWPEAAMAGALGVALSGPRSYSGAKTDDPFVNASGDRDIDENAVDRA